MSVATRPRPGDRIAAQHGPALWTAAGFVLYPLGWIGSMLAIALLEQTVLGWLGLHAEAGTLGLSVRNGLHAIVWGLLVAAVAVPLGRRLVPGVRFGRIGSLLLVIGLVIAAATIALGAEFVRARYLYYDPEYQGLSFFVGPAVVAIALATWAALAAPSGGALAPGAAALTAVAGLALALLPSLPGASDGIDTESVPLAACFLVAVAYGAVAAVLVVRRLGPAAT